LNCKINALKELVPSLRSVDEEENDDVEGEEPRRGVKCNKGIILDKAIKYIAELEREVQRLKKENSGLQLMVKGGMPNYLMLGLRR